MWEFEYKKLIDKIITQGEKRETRAGEVYSVFGEKLVIDIEDRFPLLMGRKMFYKPVLGELAAMLQGPKNIADFKKYGCNYWDAWGAKPGDCLYDGEEARGGELQLDYGNAWIDFNGINQLEKLVHTLKTNPNDRRMIITGWRPDRLGELSLPCCHMLYQWYVRDEKYLDMIWYQRSVDTMIGLPSDIILAAAWNMLLAYGCGFKPGRIIMMLADTHIYTNHLDSVDKYMSTTITAGKPMYWVEPDSTVFNFHPTMIHIEDYNPNPAIKFELNV